jgi:hypothetical protein
VRDPLAAVGQIYEQFGLDLPESSRAAMQRYLTEKPRTSRPTHRYDMGTDEEIRFERQAFAAYQEYFNVPEEI